MKKKSMIFKLSYKITIMAVCLIIVSTAVIGVVAYYNYRERSIELKTETLEQIARSAAALVDPAQYREIMTGVEKNEYHYWLADRLAEMTAIHELLIIHIGELDHVTGFKCFIEPAGINLGADLGDWHPPGNYPPEAYDAMAKGIAIPTKPLIAADYNVDVPAGVFIAVYAPVFDENGNTIAIVSACLIDNGIYADAAGFAEQMLIIVLAAIFVLMWIPVIFARRSIGKPISKLSAATNAIVGGDLSGEIEIKSKDEFAVLAGNFTHMQASIREKMEAERAAHRANLEKGKAEAAADAIKESITYASKIQRNLLPQDSDMAAVFSDYSVIWKPRDIVGGDVYWMKKFDAGTVLCVADCTGHGTPGALLTTLVTSAFESIVWDGNCDDTADIMWQLDLRLSGVLHAGKENEAGRGITDIDDGCDIVVMFISKDKSVQFSSGNIPVFVCDGREVIQHKGQKIFIGENRIKSSSEVKAICVPANPENKFYVSSDGLFDQIGGERGIQFGYDTFKRIILGHHSEKQAVITAKVWETYERYRGEEAQRDDFELVAIKP